MKTIYLISGPLGVGKTTITKELVSLLSDTFLIEGDIFLHQVDASQASWEERLRLSWGKILESTRLYLERNQNVVIDFVVEEELLWFSGALNGARVKYVVLIAKPNTLIKRLSQRNDLQFKERSLFLLEKLSKAEGNQKHLLDIEGKNIKDIVREIINSDRFMVKN